MVSKKQGGIISTRRDGRIKVEEVTPWTKTMIAVFVYFYVHNNRPSTYREITRAYTSSSYSNYQKACEELAGMGELNKASDGKFRVNSHSWKLRGKLQDTPMQRELPFAKYYLGKIKR